MTLNQLISVLQSEPNKDRRIKLGFSCPHSYRGYYEQIAFMPAHGVTVRSMLRAAKSVVGNTYQGYKGGDFVMHGYTEAHLANIGHCGESIGPRLLRYMLDDPLLPIAKSKKTVKKAVKRPT